MERPERAFRHTHKCVGLAEWIALVDDLLQRPRAEFPVAEVAMALHSTFGARQASSDPGESGDPFGLTTTELAVLGLLVDGHTTYGIARRLEMSPRTASKHLEHIYRKLDVTHRVAAVNVARASGVGGGGAAGQLSQARPSPSASRS